MLVYLRFYVEFMLSMRNFNFSLTSNNIYFCDGETIDFHFPKLCTCATSTIC